MTTRAAPPGRMHPPANITPPSQRLDDARALGLTLSQVRAGGLSAAVVGLAHHPKSWYYHLPVGITKPP
jgi:post-segregation antitoxin (ccd killing protein)